MAPMAVVFLLPATLIMEENVVGITLALASRGGNRPGHALIGLSLAYEKIYKPESGLWPGQAVGPQASLAYSQPYSLEMKSKIIWYYFVNLINFFVTTYHCSDQGMPLNFLLDL
ncbi:hypothetical protein MTR_3g070130 [Medicago truncatula]|uniref:Transmembrane protein n=1 Tax=Medicago truncatula TaxID=3880 RepID=G7JAP3_MEDTR|nr:hypothetical protein MTR_3g070130 [Medicago truncatula]